MTVLPLKNFNIIVLSTISRILKSLKQHYQENFIFTSKRLIINMNSAKVYFCCLRCLYQDPVKVHLKYSVQNEILKER